MDALVLGHGYFKIDGDAYMLSAVMSDPAGGAYSAPPGPIAEFQGSPSKQGEGKGRKGRERGNKSPEWLSQKLGSTANAAARLSLWPTWFTPQCTLPLTVVMCE